MWDAYVPPALRADRVTRATLYSIDFRDEGERAAGTGETLHGYAVLGSVELSDEQRHQVVTALASAIEAANPEDVVACFAPRHVLRVEQDGRTMDYVICFHCRNYRLIAEGRPLWDRSTRLISREAEKTFNEVPEGSDIPIVPKWPSE